MVRQLGWRGPVDILENGSDAPMPDEDGFLDKDVDRIVVLGRLVPHKRVDLVLQAMHELRFERPRPAPRRVRSRARSSSDFRRSPRSSASPTE